MAQSAVIDLTEDEAKDEEEKQWDVLEGDDCLLDARKDASELLALRSRGLLWSDDEFPATKKSICGDEKEAEESENLRIRREDAAIARRGGVPSCRCGKEAATTTVTKKTPNEGRKYYCCGTRSCAFFTWTDGEAPWSRRDAWKNVKWTRFDGAPLVDDGGFSANDLRQGRLGDCWFISALAVIAERKDLIERLFVGDSGGSNSAKAGVYGCRLFLDGKWRVIYVDDRLPMLKNERNEWRPAFARCLSTRTGKSTLWASILEKSYAKAHGSYKAISGGQISEALRDLSGANTISVDIPSTSFEALEEFFHKLHKWKNFWKLPCGCATSSASDPLLNGNHAYSILAVRAYEEGRLLRVRDPHGLSQFPAVSKLAREVAQRLKMCSSLLLDDHDRALIRDSQKDDSDGTFWMDYAFFVAAFSRVDVALAYEPGTFYGCSVDRCFPPSRNARTRACDDGQPLIVSGLQKNIELSVSCAQPTNRGARCRADRKKSYRPGDLSVVVCDFETGESLASCFYGAEVGDVDFTCCCRLSARQEVAVYCLSLGKNPTAAMATTTKQPFFLRICADGPIRISRGQHMKAPSVALAAHAALRGPEPTRRDQRPQKRRWMQITAQLRCLIVEADGLLCVVAVNDDDKEAVTVEAVAFCKSAIARASDSSSLLEDDTQAANAYYEARKDLDAKQISFRWPAKWKCFRATTRVPSNRRRLVLVVARSGVQWCLGDVDCRLAPVKSQGKIQTSIFAADRPVFAPVDNAFFGGKKKTKKKRPRDQDDGLRRAIAESLDDDLVENDDLQRAIDFSKVGDATTTEDTDLARALELSRQEALQPQPMDDDLQRAIELSRQDIMDDHLILHPRKKDDLDDQRAKLADALAKRGL